MAQLADWTGCGLHRRAGMGADGVVADAQLCANHGEESSLGAAGGELLVETCAGGSSDRLYWAQRRAAPQGFRILVLHLERRGLAGGLHFGVRVVPISSRGRFAANGSGNGSVHHALPGAIGGSDVEMEAGRTMAMGASACASGASGFRLSAELA